MSATACVACGVSNPKDYSSVSSRLLREALYDSRGQIIIGVCVHGEKVVDRVCVEKPSFQATQIRQMEACA